MQSLPRRVRDWARCHFDKMALDDGVVSMSYGELDQRLQSYAAKLSRQGINPHDRVIIALPKSSEAIAAILGTLCLGATYVPIDTKAPRERIDAIVRDSNASAVISTDETWHNDYPSLVLVTPQILTATPYTEESISSLRDDAYILYTSGSTGVPNGVRISHLAMTSFFNSVNSYMGVDQFSRCLSTSALYFDVSVIDALLPLYQGASVWLGPDIPMPMRLLHLIDQQEITHFCAVGSTLTVLSSLPGFAQRTRPHLQRIMTGAEVLNPTTMRRWLDTAPTAKILNGYGPTEVTCISTVFTIDRKNVDAFDAYPIGGPLPGLTIRIDSDASGIGELWLSGNQVTNGYVNRDALNEQRLVTIDGKTWYRTGDKVRFNDQGQLEFLGRIDDEVKVRGYRVHLDDVAQPYRNLPAVTDAHALKITHERTGECLAIVVQTESAPEEWPSLMQSANEQLPSYMQPKFWLASADFPKKPSGKVDVSKVRQHATRIAVTLEATCYSLVMREMEVSA